MGMDFLDLTFRIEKSFEIKIGRLDYERLPQRKPFDVTAGELHDWVTALLVDRDVKVPWSSWTRIRIAVAGVVSKPPQVVHRDTMVVKDLGFSV